MNSEFVVDTGSSLERSMRTCGAQAMSGTLLTWITTPFCARVLPFPPYFLNYGLMASRLFRFMG